MQQYLYVLGLAALPALGNLAGGLIAELVPLSGSILSFALYVAAGIILAVIGIELLATAMQAEQTWLNALAFVAGGGFAVLLDKTVDWVRERFKARSDAGPWMIYVGVNVDPFSDGIMIGTGAAIATVKRQRLARTRRILLSLSFFIPVLAGATVGYWAMRDVPEIYKFALLAFTGGVLITTVIEEMMVHAHDEQTGEESGWQTMALVGGFALFMIVSAYLE